MLGRAISRMFEFALCLAVLAPLLALVPATVCDIGPAPDSRVRLSLFPAALTALDPLVRTSLWNSVMAALVITVAALVIGVTLGRLADGPGFWGRPVLWAAVSAPAVFAPAFLALGVVALCGPEPARRLVAIAVALGIPESESQATWRWVAWVWGATIQGAAVVGWTTRSVLRHSQGHAADAARLGGMRPLKAWWTLTWPVLSPSLARTACLVFVINLADPGAPLLLGLRRTLGFQITASLLGPDPFPRSTVMAWMIAAIGLACGLLAARASSSRAAPGMAERTGYRPVDVPRSRAAWPRVLLSWLMLGGWSLLAWAPVLGLLRLGSLPVAATEGALPADGLSIIALLRRWTAEPAGALLARSALVGLVVGVAAWVLAWRPCRESCGPSARRRRHAALLVAMPPLAVGVGILALGQTALLGARYCSGTLYAPGAVYWLQGIAVAFDPVACPGLALYAGVMLACLPRGIAGRPAGSGREQAVAHQLDQLRLCGAVRTRAAGQIWSRARGISPRLILLWGVLTATAVSPAMVLVPSLQESPLGPGIVMLANQPGDARRQAAALALGALALNALVLGWATWRQERTCLEATDLL